MAKDGLKTTDNTTNTRTRQPLVVGDTAHIKLLAQIVHQNEFSQKGVHNCFGVVTDDLLAMAKLLFPGCNFWHTEFNASGEFWRMARLAIRVQYPCISSCPIASWVSIDDGDLKEGLNYLKRIFDGEEYVPIKPDRSDEPFRQTVFFQHSVARVQFRSLGNCFMSSDPYDLWDLALLLCQTSSRDSSAHVFLQQLLGGSLERFQQETRLVNDRGIKLYGFVLPSD